MKSRELLFLSCLLFCCGFEQVQGFKYILIGINGTLSVDVWKLPAEVQHLEIGPNKIEAIGTGAICTTSELQTVKIDFSTTPKPPTLHQDMFENCDNLTQLTILGNKKNRTQLDSGVLQNFANLKQLTAQFFNIHRLTVDFFNGMTSLTSLTLHHCRILEVDPGVFDDLKSLHNISFKNNLIETIPANLFKSLSRLERLNLEHNRISHLNGSEFNGLSSLENLNLRFNRIGSLDRGAFHDLKNLKWMSLKNNKITVLPASLFENLAQLKTLNLSHNNISSLSWDEFEGLSSLEYLKLEHNNIASFDVDKIFKSLPKLKKMGVVGNANCDAIITFEIEVNKKFGRNVVHTGFVPFNDYVENFCESEY